MRGNKKHFVSSLLDSETYTFETWRDKVTYLQWQLENIERLNG